MKNLILVFLLAFSFTCFSQDYTPLSNDFKTEKRGLKMKTETPKRSATTRRSQPPSTQCEITIHDFLHVGGIDAIPELPCDGITFVIEYTDSKKFLKEAEIAQREAYPDQRWFQYCELLELYSEKENVKYVVKQPNGKFKMMPYGEIEFLKKWHD